MVDFNGQELGIRWQGIQQGPGRAAGARAQFHYQPGLFDDGCVNEPPLQKARARNDGADQIGMAEKSSEKGEPPVGPNLTVIL